jgi:hypothetical protein
MNEDRQTNIQGYHVQQITEAIQQVDPFYSTTQVYKAAEELGIIYSERDLGIGESEEKSIIAAEDIFHLGNHLGTDISGEDLENSLK